MAEPVSIMQYNGVKADEYGNVREVRFRKPTDSAKFADESYAPTPFVPPHCQGVVKSTGSACTAPIVRGHHLCIGHLRQAEKEHGPSDD